MLPSCHPIDRASHARPLRLCPPPLALSPQLPPAAHHPGRPQPGAARRHRAPHLRKLHGPGGGRLLHGHTLPPVDQELHGPGRGPHGDGRRRRLGLRRQVWRRVRRAAAARGARGGGHGQLGAGHQRLAVLHPLQVGAPPGLQAHRLRPRRGRCARAPAAVVLAAAQGSAAGGARGMQFLHPRPAHCPPPDAWCWHAQASRR
jgi:hypothetical protein